jgi:hypothetical protein
LFAAKLGQLRRYEEMIAEEEGLESSRLEIATLAAGSEFATTFIFRFKRGLLEPKKYTQFERTP